MVAVRAAVRRVARRAGSNLAVSEAAPPASGGTLFSTLRDVVAWASAARKVRNDIGPKAVTVDGMRSPPWTKKKRLLAFFLTFRPNLIK